MCLYVRGHDKTTIITKAIDLYTICGNILQYLAFLGFVSRDGTNIKAKFCPLRGGKEKWIF